MPLVLHAAYIALEQPVHLPARAHVLPISFTTRFCASVKSNGDGEKN